MEVGLVGSSSGSNSSGFCAVSHALCYRTHLRGAVGHATAVMALSALPTPRAHPAQGR